MAGNLVALLNSIKQGFGYGDVVGEGGFTQENQLSSS